MAQTLTADLSAYRISLWGEPDPRWRRCLAIAGALGIATLIAVYVVPPRPVEITSVDQVPDRFAKLILEEATPPTAPAQPRSPEAIREKPPEIVTEPKVTPVEVSRREPRRRAPSPPQTVGKAGREKAKQVTQELAAVQSELSSVLADVSTSLASTSDDVSTKRRSPRGRRTRSGRRSSELAGVTGPAPTVDPGAATSRLEGTSIAIAEIETISEGATESGATAAGQRSQIRSDAQLLAVVRKYAPGIQFCYDNELKKAPGLGGKLLVSITVTATGRVTDAEIVQDTVGSAGLARCALAQVEAWKFPSVEAGTVVFQAPFVFTPPE
jgi:TonB family protein